MDEQNRAPPKALSIMTPTTIAVEEAQTDIKEAAKDAVLKNQDETEYFRRVGEILKKRLAHIANPRLRDSALISLTRFARTQFDDEKKLMQLYAQWFKTMSEAKALGLPNATPLYRAMIKTVGSVKESIGFKLTVLEGATPIVLNRPDLTSAEVEYDPTLSASAYNVAMPLGEFQNTYLERVEDMKKRLIDSGAVDPGGLSLRNLAEMAVRSERQTKMITDLRDSGVKLVYIEPHVNCSKRCEPYQVGGSKHPSGLYSLNGETGETEEDHVKYLPLEFATENPDDLYITQQGKAYQNGCILGFNCRHRLVPYKPHTQPIPIPKAKIEEMREIETNQREMERGIRLLRGKELQATSQADITKLKKLIKKAENEYVSYSLKNEMAYYLRRTEIF